MSPTGCRCGAGLVSAGDRGRLAINPGNRATAREGEAGWGVWRLLAYRTGIPMTTVRRRTAPFLPQHQAAV